MTYEGRAFSYSRLSKLIDHVESAHLRKIPEHQAISCRHPMCMYVQRASPKQPYAFQEPCTAHPRHQPSRIIEICIQAMSAADLAS